MSKNIIKRILTSLVIATFAITLLPFSTPNVENFKANALAENAEVLKEGTIYIIKLSPNQYKEYRFKGDDSNKYRVSIGYISGEGECETRHMTPDGGEMASGFVLDTIHSGNKSIVSTDQIIGEFDYDVITLNELRGKSIEISFCIKKLSKAKNPLKAKGKTAKISYKKLKRKNQTIKTKKAFQISNAKGKISFKKIKGNKKISVSKNGKVKIKKGLKKGKYKLTVMVTAAGNSQYEKASKRAVVTVKIR